MNPTLTIRWFVVPLALLAGYLQGQAAVGKTDDPIQAKNQSAQDCYLAAIGAAQSVYREQLAELFDSADKAVIYLLDFDVEETGFEVPLDHFPIRPYGAGSRILGERALGKDQIRKLAVPLRAMVTGETAKNPGALCHYPMHGLRLWRGPQLLFESSFCWECHNYFIAYPNGESRWHGVTNEVAEEMKKLLPIPHKEVVRFQNRFRGQPKAKPISLEERASGLTLSRVREIYEKEEERNRGFYLSNFADVLKGADKVELLAIDFENEAKKPNPQPAIPGFGGDPEQFFKRGGDYRIFERRLLSPEDVTQILTQLRAALSEFESGVTPLEIFPMYGMRIWRKDELLFEERFDLCTSYCTFHFPDGYDYSPIPLVLNKLIERLLPLPGELLERFKKTHDPTPAVKDASKPRGLR